MLKGEIAFLIASETGYAVSMELADRIISLPEMVELREKAHKRDIVMEAYKSSPPCNCPKWDSENEECQIEGGRCPFDDVAHAIEDAQEAPHE